MDAVACCARWKYLRENREGIDAVLDGGTRSERTVLRTATSDNILLTPCPKIGFSTKIKTFKKAVVNRW